MIPKFLNFHLANRSLRFSLTYAHCQSNLLLEKIRLKKSNVGALKKEFDNLRPQSSNQIQQKKFCNLLKEKCSTQNPEKVIFNFSEYVLLYCEKSLLQG